MALHGVKIMRIIIIIFLWYPVATHQLPGQDDGQKVKKHLQELEAAFRVSIACELSYIQH